MSDAPPPTDSWSRFSTAYTACMMHALKLRPKYWSLVDTYVDLGTIYVDAPIEIRALAQEDRHRILKTLEVQAAPDAVPGFPNLQMCKILKISGRCMSRLFMRHMCRILKIKCLSQLLIRQTEMRRILMSEPAPHTSAERRYVS